MSKNPIEQRYLDWARKKVGDIDYVERELHGDQSVVLKLQTNREIYFFKIAQNLQKEHERLLWLWEKISVPKLIGFEHVGERDCLLMSAIQGRNLKDLSKEWPVERVVGKLVQALRGFHSVSIRDCPFGRQDDDGVLIHGDACLPNFMFLADGEFAGYVDLGDVTVGSPEVDFAAAVWSLQHNLGPGYGKMFLEEYGMENVTEKIVERMRLKYEDMQREWGL